MSTEMQRRMLGNFERMRHEMDRLFESVMPGQRLPARHSCLWCPPTDVYETLDAAVVKVEIAGVDEEAFRISFSDGTLTVSGVRQERGRQRRAYQQMEIWSGPFRTQVEIPWPIDADAVEAQYRDGFLTVRFPKSRSQSKQVPIRTTEEK